MLPLVRRHVSRVSGLNCDEGLTAWQNEHVFTKFSTLLFILGNQKDSRIMCLVFSIPQSFWYTSDRAFLYNVYGSTILSLFKRMLFSTQSSCKIFEKGYKLGEFFGQLLPSRAFITKFNVSFIRSFMSDFVNIYWLRPCFYDEVHIFVASHIHDFSILLCIESLERASAWFSVPFLYFISKSNCYKR